MPLKTKLFLIFIVIAAFVIRIYSANNYLPLSWDEAALGYNAYSIIHTGKDEFGKTLPLIFKSFGDYKPGIYIYLSAPFIALFGLTELAVRFPSIILGSIAPLILYFLIKEINPKSHKLALISALILAFNPFNIHFSKAAWETNILTFELILSSFLFFKYLNKHKSINLLLSAIVFGISLYTYQAGKMIALFIIIILFIINFSSIKPFLIKKIFPFFIVPLGILALPIASGLIFNSDSNRLKVISLFSYPRSETETQMIINETNKFDYQLFYGRIQFFTRNFLSRYFNHFSPRFLAFEGDWQSPRHSAPYIGVILYPSLIFLILGIFLSFKKFEKINLFFLLWLLVAPIPSALTRDSVQSVRAMSLSVPLVYFISLGIFFAINKYKSFWFSGFLVLIYLLSFIYYSDLYYNHMIKKSPNDFLYGYKQAAEFVINNQNKYQDITFTDFYGQPYVFYLFYSHYDPVKYQSVNHYIESNSLDTGKVENIDNIKFKSADFNYAQTHPNTLTIFSYDEILRQGIDKKEIFKQFIPLSPINNISTFYAYTHE